MSKDSIDKVVKEGVGVLDFEPPVTAWASTGCTLLDLAISNQLPGGFPAGRITHLFGAESSAKSVLAAEAIGSVQRQGGIGYFADAEQTFDSGRASLVYGVDVEDDSFRYSTPTILEELFDVSIRNAQKECIENDIPLSMMVVDSLAALPSGKEIEETKGERLKLADMKGYGASRAKTLSTAFRTNQSSFCESNLGMVFVDQTRANLSSPWGGTTTSSGQAIKFYSSVRIDLVCVKQLVNKHKKNIGIIVRAKVVKNKTAPPKREIKFMLTYDYGIDDIGSNLMFLKAELDKSSKSHTFAGHKGSLEVVSKAVEENELEEDLRMAVWEVWKEVYKVPERLPKKRVR